jgi:hypothetical protein
MNDTTLQTAQGLRLNLKYGSATFTAGTGGSAPTPRPTDPGDAAASLAARRGAGVRAERGRRLGAAEHPDGHREF